MARARNIKPGFFKNADLVELTMETRLLFIGLWTLADRAGRLEDRPKQIKMELFPADAVDVNACLDDLQRWGFVQRYEGTGKRLIQITNFAKHQNPHRDEKASALPAPDANTVQAPCDAGADTVPIGLIADSLIPDSGSLSADNAPDGAAPADADGPSAPTMAGAVCITLKAKGVPDVNPSHPDLLSLLAAGADIGSFAAAAEKAVKAGKGKFAYVLGVVRGQAADAQRMAANARASPPASKQSTLEARNAATAARILENLHAAE